MNKLKKRAGLIPVIVILAVVIALWVAGDLLDQNSHVYATDDAQVTGYVFNTVKIQPRISGILTQLDVQEGDSITANQIIGVVKPVSTQSSGTPLRAYETGVIVNVPAVVGQQVTTATTVARMAILQSVKITAYVDAS